MWPRPLEPKQAKPAFTAAVEKPEGERKPERFFGRRKAARSEEAGSPVSKRQSKNSPFCCSCRQKQQCQSSLIRPGWRSCFFRCFPARQFPITAHGFFKARQDRIKQQRLNPSMKTFGGTVVRKPIKGLNSSRITRMIRINAHVRVKQAKRVRAFMAVMHLLPPEVHKSLQCRRFFDSCSAC